MSDNILAVVTDLNLDECGSDLNAVFHRARSAKLSVKSSREVCRSWDVFQIWRDWFGKFGEFKLLRHRSPPDDPPDVELVFAARIVAFEDTRLQPEHLGRAEALRDRKIAPDVCTTVPAISKPIKSSEQLIERMLGIPQDDLWTNVADEHAALLRLLNETIRKKIDRLPDGGIIGIIDEVAVMGHTLEFMFQAAEELIESNEFSDFGNRVLIIQSRLNVLQYTSALITRSDGRLMRSSERPAIAAGRGHGLV
jgi:hypothetical protein